MAQQKIDLETGGGSLQYASRHILWKGEKI